MSEETKNFIDKQIKKEIDDGIISVPTGFGGDDFTREIK